MLEFILDPVLRGPTLACMFLGALAGLVGSLNFVVRRSLVGETLSHAAYPGVAFAFFLAYSEVDHLLLASLGAFCSSALGYWLLGKLSAQRFSQDAALTWVLSSSLGLGVLFVSRLQFAQPAAYLQVQNYLYGQAATMTDFHIWLYGLCFIFSLLLIMAFFKEIKSHLFDPSYAKLQQLSSFWVKQLIFVLTVFTVVVGIRGGGVVLMAALMIAPPIGARQLTSRLSQLLGVASLMGALGGILGNVLSVYVERALSKQAWSVVVPTGPSIALILCTMAFLLLLFSPRQGLLIRYLRIFRFKSRRLEENILKAIWRDKNKVLSTERLAHFLHLSRWKLWLAIWRLERGCWVKRKRGSYGLTSLGDRRAQHIVRLHRLWELYLVQVLGMGKSAVHANAEEMEHILTHEMEEELTQLLKDPTYDPHKQPIPKEQLGVDL